MHEGRSDHGSCAVSNYVYVSCGQTDGGRLIKYLQSIERINVDAIDDGWEELLVSSGKKLSPRSHIFMAALSCNELVILGGAGKRDDKVDGYILEIPKMRLKTVIRNTDNSNKFAALSN